MPASRLIPRLRERGRRVGASRFGVGWESFVEGLLPQMVSDGQREKISRVACDDTATACGL